jgi:hypothetical protein
LRTSLITDFVDPGSNSVEARLWKACADDGNVLTFNMDSLVLDLD